MIKVKLEGEREHESQPYVATAESDTTLRSEDGAIELVQYLAEQCTQQWVDEVTNPGEIKSITVTVSYDDEVPPEIEATLADQWNADNVSIRYTSNGFASDT